ncbi:MAG TPA: DUF3341 domain-containing protein [Gemmataceae bacterium]|nr:DUF3341 domain-containing protein [Gemmataceae bacterium]
MTSHVIERPPIHGLMAEFATAEEILRAARRTTLAGYRHVDAYTPLPVEGLAEELGLPRTRVPFVVLAGGLVGVFAGFFMQYWASWWNYPMNVGGRPFNSYPVFVPIAFELMVLIASLAAIFGMFFLNGLPEPYHPVFHAPNFDRVTQDRYFLCIEATDPHFDMQRTREFMQTLGGIGEVAEVPH